MAAKALNFAPMHVRRNLILLFTANTISNFASGITMLAVPWYLVNLPNEENGKFKAISMMAIITFATLFWGVYAGTLVDKYNRKRLFQYLQLTDGSLLILAGLGGWGMATTPYWTVVVAAAVTICSWNLFFPNLYAFCQELVRPELYKKVNSAIELQGQVTNFMGMLVGSVLLAGKISIHTSWFDWETSFEAWSLSKIFLVDGITYLCSMLIVTGIKYKPGAYILQKSGNVWQQVLQGFQFLREKPALMLFGLVSYNIFATLLVFLQIGLAIYVSAHLGYSYEEGASIIAGFEVFYSLGAILAGVLGILLARVMAKSNLLVQVTCLLFMAMLVYGFLTFFKSEVIFFIAGFLIGVANAGARILRVTYIVRIVPNTMIGRVNAFFRIVNTSIRLSLLCMLLLPFFSDEGNGHHIVLATGVMGLLVGISGLLMVVFFRKFDQKAAYG